MEYDALVIGGGFFGASLALHLRQALGYHVGLVEREPQLLGRASYVNQARVHAGYHYPRSFTTAYRSQVNYTRFVNEFQDCVDTHFTKYYAIGRKFSKVTARQFQRFCEQIGAPLTPAPSAVKRWFNPALIEDVFIVRECAFDAAKLRQRLTQALQAAGVEIHWNTEAESVCQHGEQLVVHCANQDGSAAVNARRVFNCTYARINQLLAASHLPLIPLKHELAELALVEPPPELEQSGVTVMCGPFFSIMPFPARGLHSLSHVRYTPHCEWYTGDQGYQDPYARFATMEKVSNYLPMIKDAQRYLPLLQHCRYAESIWEIKTVLPRSEADDSRPILLKQDHGLPNLSCVTGAKVDNIYDVLSLFESMT